MIEIKIFKWDIFYGRHCRIHIGNKSNSEPMCPDLYIHEDVMKSSTKEKYLGDIISTKGATKTTLEDRKKKGYAIVAEILAILKDIPLGQHMMEIGLQLRQAMLLNGILYNREAWHDISDDDIKVLESIDEHMLRSLVKAHSKTPLEFLYMKTASTPIRHIVSCRRLLYLQKILKS